jgi:hypothetical protein
MSIIFLGCVGDVAAPREMLEAGGGSEKCVIYIPKTNESFWLIVELVKASKFLLRTSDNPFRQLFFIAQFDFKWQIDFSSNSQMENMALEAKRRRLDWNMTRALKTLQLFLRKSSGGGAARINNSSSESTRNHRKLN